MQTLCGQAGARRQKDVRFRMSRGSCFNFGFRHNLPILCWPGLQPAACCLLHNAHPQASTHPNLALLALLSSPFPVQALVGRLAFSWTTGDTTIDSHVYEPGDPSPRLTYSRCSSPIFSDLSSYSDGFRTTAASFFPHLVWPATAADPSFDDLA